MAAAFLILLVAGFTAYTLLSPTLGVILWGAALVAGLAGSIRSVSGPGKQARWRR